MTVEQINAEIETLSHRRQELWATGFSDPVEVKRIGRKLEDLYEARRSTQAQNQHGGRKQIFHRARIDYELEKLMTEAV